jgi:cell division septal protein FtsQ
MRKRLIATLILILITLLGGMLYVLYTSSLRHAHQSKLEYTIMSGTQMEMALTTGMAIKIGQLLIFPYLTFTIQQTKMSLKNTWIGSSMRV